LQDSTFFFTNQATGKINDDFDLFRGQFVYKYKYLFTLYLRYVIFKFKKFE